MKQYFIVYALIILGVACAITYRMMHHYGSSSHLKIAIIQPVSHPALNDIVQGFQKTIHKAVGKKYAIDCYNANGDSSVLKAQIEDILNKNYKLICTVATDPTIMAVTAARKKDSSVPIVFAAAEPVADIASDERVTGTKSEQNFTAQIDALLAIKPTTHAVMIVYNPAIKAGTNEHDKEKLSFLLRARGITVSDVPVFNTEEIMQRTSAALHHHTPDVIMVLMDNTVVSGIDALVILCNKNGITLYTSDHNSGKVGAALSFGHVQSEFGAAAAEKALAILEQGKKPREIPISDVSKQFIHVNRTVAEQQGIPLTQSLIDTIAALHGVII